MAKKIVRYYNYVVKVETETLDENKSIASDINGWLGGYLADDNDFSDGSWSHELVKYSLVRKKVKK